MRIAVGQLQSPWIRLAPRVVLQLPLQIVKVSMLNPDKVWEIFLKNWCKIDPENSHVVYCTGVLRKVAIYRE